MKKYISLFSFLLLSILLVLPVSAATVPFEDFKMVLSNDPLNPLSRSEVDTFSLDQTPYLYVKLPENTYKGLLHDFNLTLSLWQETGGKNFGYDAIISNDQENWLTPSNWNQIKDLGNWDVSGSYHYLGGLHGSGNTSFTVNPEPVSSLLFLFGGAPLAASFLRKRKII